MEKTKGHWYGRLTTGRVVFSLFVVLCLIGLFFVVDYLESNLYQGDMPGWIEWLLMGAFLIVVFVPYQVLYGNSNGPIQNDVPQRSMEQ